MNKVKPDPPPFSFPFIEHDFSLELLRAGVHPAWPADWVYDDQARAGDHICYYSDLRRMQADYPGWRPEISLGETFDQIVAAHASRAKAS